MRIYLVRHAEAVGRELGLAEPLRHLTPHGRSQVSALGRRLQKRGVRPSLIVCSPLVRAVQTAELLAAALGDGTPVTCAEVLGLEHGLQQVLTLIRAATAKRLMLVGHEPQLSALAVELTGCALPVALQKGSCLALTWRPDSGRQAVLAWYISGDNGRLLSFDSDGERRPDEALQRYAQYLQEQWQLLLRLRAAVLDRFQEDDIHDLRVTGRRIRVAAQVAASCADCGALRGLRRPLRRLVAELGSLRNLDEARRYFEGLRLAGLQPLCEGLLHQRGVELRKVRQLLEELPLARMERVLQQIGRATGQVGAALADGLAKQERALYRPIRELLQSGELGRSARQRHALRIAVKKWRYFSELQAVVLSCDRQRRLEQLKRYQGLLGELNDLEVFAELLQQTTAVTQEQRSVVARLMTGRTRRLLQRLRGLLRTSPIEVMPTGKEQ